MSLVTDAKVKELEARVVQLEKTAEQQLVIALKARADAERAASKPSEKKSVPWQRPTL